MQASRGPSRRKILLMGRHNSGKTSMRSVIFSNILARDTNRLSVTISTEHSSFRILKNLVLNLWDLGGQDHLYRAYFESQREHIFRHVETLVYVFDSKHIEEKDLIYFHECMDALARLSPAAAVFIMIHKIDPKDGTQEEKDEIFRSCESRIVAQKTSLRTQFFPTSIFDDSLVLAWSAVVEALVPDLGTIRTKLSNLAMSLGADEIVLFERATFLVMASAKSPLALSNEEETLEGQGLSDASRDRSKRRQVSMHRFQQISTAVKRFRTCCNNARYAFESMHIQAHDFGAFLQLFTESTVILVTVSDPKKIGVENVNRILGGAKTSFDELLG